MANCLNIELCPETGICSILGKEGKVDLMPDEVEALRAASGDPEALRKLLAECDASFAGKLGSPELEYLKEFFS